MEHPECRYFQEQINDCSHGRGVTTPDGILKIQIKDTAATVLAEIFLYLFDEFYKACSYQIVEYNIIAIIMILFVTVPIINDKRASLVQWFLVFTNSLPTIGSALFTMERDTVEFRC